MKSFPVRLAEDDNTIRYVSSSRACERLAEQTRPE